MVFRLYIYCILILIEEGKNIKLLDIGSTVKIDIERIQDKIPTDLKKTLFINSIAKVSDYKITDGTGIGFLLELSNGSKHWFFNHEITLVNNAIDPLAEGTLSSPPLSKSLYKGNNLSYVVNPIYFATWLMHVTKDIF